MATDLKYGLASNIKQQLSGFSRERFSKLMEIIPVRVKHIILDDKDDLFKEFGEWNSIGTIFYNSVENPTPNDYSKNNFAKALFPNTQNYPLVNEIVYIISLPNPDIQENTSNKSQYYFQPINLWNSVHHNAVPDNVWESTLPESQQKDYQQIEGGSARRVTDNSTEITLGDYFIEQLDVRNLIPYEGDVIHQGRWGNSIRFTSTNPGNNNWSENGDEGDALTIIRNGQPTELDTDPWVPISENINKDKSSIYLTTSQKIPIEVASNSYNSYENAPTSPNEYVEDQIILNSGRLLFNSKSDSILLSSNQSINLNSINSVNIDTSTLSVKADKILLGSKDATEAVLLGDKTVDTLKDIVTQINNVFDSFAKVIGNMGIPLIEQNAESIKARLNLESIKNQLDNLKSETSFTK